MKWERLGKKILIIILLIIISRWISKKYVNVHQRYSIDVLQPSKFVWDFVADLNHMKITNPGLKTFEIISDGGKHPEWQYSAILTEIRDQFGLINIHASFIVKPQGEDYLIISTYDLCKLFICAYVNSTMTFKDNNEKNYKTRIIEDLDIVLSYIFSWFISTDNIANYHKEKLSKIVSHLNNNRLN